MKNTKRKHETLPYDNNKKEIIYACERVLSNDYSTHSHNFFEIEFLIEGTGVQVINETAHPWLPGTICFFSPTDFHEIIANSPLRLYNISFDFDFLSNETKDKLMNLSENVFYTTDIELEHFKKIASMLVDTSSHTLMFNLEYKMSLLNSFLIGLNKISNQVSHLSSQLPAIKQAILFMHANFNNKITLSDISNSANLSPTYFSELFSDKMDMTVSQYLLQIRIDYAKKLLDTTNDSVTNICYECGFTSVSNFMKIFKKTVGTSPLKYKNRGTT